MNEFKGNIVVVGLGYVGLPIAISFGKYFNVIGFDIDKRKIELYKKGVDVTNQVTKEELEKANIRFTNKSTDIGKGDLVIVTVPTPIDKYKKPDLGMLISATKMIGQNIKKGAVVVYESTVYPGVTEDVCIPILENESKLKCGIDFKVGYSPERINIGDKEHTFENVKKVVSGIDEETVDIITKIYSKVIKAGIVKVSSIKVAEAAKIIENTQRDINIAFINEMSVLLKKLGIETKEVLEAANTKWNYIDVKPGLVGGHCIGVDPYYLIYKAKEIGVKVNMTENARIVNEDISEYIGKNVLKTFIDERIEIKEARVLIKGITFKENVNDIRNSKIVNVIKELESYGMKVLVEDILANKEEVEKEYGIVLEENVTNVDSIIFAVAHNEYKQTNYEEISRVLKKDRNWIFDLKSILDKKDLEDKGLKIWQM